MYLDNFEGVPEDAQHFCGQCGGNSVSGHDSTCDDTRDSDRYTATSTASTPACSALQNDGCEHCHAAYGHTSLCPTLNRNVAETRSTQLSEADTLRLAALGVRWN